MNAIERAAALMHGLSHEVAALTEAKRTLVACCPSTGKTLDRMIETRKARISQFAAQVAGHA